MRRRYREITFRDELLADLTVHRAYDDGRQEWRRREPDSVVSWRDDRGRSGTDEQLGSGIIKRRIEPDTVLYGRDIGYGRTTWSDLTLTINQTSFGGRAGLIIAGIGAAGLLPAIVDPPFALGPEEEEELRRQQQQAQQSSSSGGGGDSGGSSEAGSEPSSAADWSGSADGMGDDFG